MFLIRYREATGRTVKLLTYYRSSSGSFSILVVLEHVYRLEDILMVNGDFNFNLLTNLTEKSKLINLFYNIGAVQITEASTREHFSTNLDVNLYQKCNIVVSDTYTSDHESIVLKTHISEFTNVSAQDKIHKRFFTEKNVGKFYNLLLNECWNSENDMNINFKLFMERFLYCFDVCFPVRYVAVSQRKGT